ncbi:MAG TPA: monovalent cation/H+ antiporter subunit D family protein [Bacillota bacterium]|nr:monovalent cation/H+ antiporter subunit D family protein [Bacillota bacterium]
MMEHSPVLVVMAPFIGAYFIPLLGLWRKQYCYPLAAVAAGLSALFSIILAGSVLTQGTIRYAVGGWPAPYGIELVVDPLSAFMCLVISLVSLLVVAYSRDYIEKELPEGKTTSYCTLVLLLVGGLLGVVVTGDLFNLFVMTEIFSVAAYALVPMGGKRGSFLASYRYLILASIGTSLILLATGYLYMVTGTLNMADLAARLPLAYEHHPWVVLAALAFFLVGFGIKSALFPLHAWLPDAYSVAPAPVLVLSTLVTKVGAYSLIRVLLTVFGFELIAGTIPVASALTWVAAAAIFAGSLFAIAQTDIIKMLAYSSVAHIGYVMLGVGLAVPLGLTGGVLHILNHTLAKACLILCAGAVIYGAGIRRIDDFRGLGRTMPLTTAAFTLAAASMVGVPPTAGFMSKLYLALGALETGRWVFVAIILAGGLLTALVYLRVITLMYFRGHGETLRRDEPPLGMLVPIVLLALASAMLGTFVGMPLSLVEPAVRLLLGM